MYDEFSSPKLKVLRSMNEETDTVILSSIALLCYHTHNTFLVR